MVLAFSIVVFFCVIGYIIYFLKIDSTVVDSTPLIDVVSNNIEEMPSNIDESKICEGCVRRDIDGVFVELDKKSLYPYAVIIDNNQSARPQHGLGYANLVYEVEAEGGITRYFAIFANNQEVLKIGPVRSVRPYFIEIAKEYSALIAHVGGSPQALAIILKDGVFDINEFYNEHYFWRDNSRNAPYNVYTSSEKINDYLGLKNVQEGKFLTWKFKEDGKRTVASNPIKINYQADKYTVEWKYDSEANAYTRYLDGSEHLDEDGVALQAKNVVIQYLKVSVTDNEGRLAISMIGYGDALVCLDGACSRAVWKKPSSQARTRYYIDEDEIEFNAGKIWINIVRPDYKVEY